ncbi:MAG: ribonuclease P protein component [Emcibacteraceae bacterium]
MMSQAIDNKRKKIETLKKRSDFLRVAETRKKWISPAIILQVAKQKDNVSDKIRVGYTASKKVGNAVLRNRAKRRMREAAQLVMSENGVKNHDYVLIARKEITERPYIELIRDLKWSLKRLHVEPDDKRTNDR